MKALLRARADTDLVHVHGVYLANSIWAYLIARARGMIYVVQPHGALEPSERRTGRGARRVLERLIGRRILAGAAAVIATSGSEASQLRARLPAANVVTEPVGVTRREPLIDPDLEWQLASWLSVPSQQRVLFLGPLVGSQHPDLLIDAWNRVRSAERNGQLLSAGSAQDWDIGTLRARVAPQERHRVTFLDAVTPATAAWLMTAAGVVTLPGESANDAVPVAEALLYGCAVLTTEQTAAAEHVIAAGAGIVLARPDGDLLHQALTDLLAEPERVAAMADSGRYYAEDELTSAAASFRLAETYRQLLPRPRRPS